jgi:hypothetical protein
MSMDKSKYCDYTNVPVELCVFSLQNRKANQVRLFLYFKSNSNGYLKNKREIYVSAANRLNNNIKTIHNHLNWLIKEGWIIPDINVNSICIISFEKLAKKLGFRSPKGALLYKSDICHFKSFAIASVIKYNLMRINGRKHQAGLKMWSPKLGENPPYPHLTHNYLAKVLNKSKSAISEYKKLASTNKFLTCEKKYEDLKISPRHYSHLREYGPYESEKLIKKSSTILRQLPDKIDCSVKLRNKWNLREVCRKNRYGKKTESS